MTRKPFRQSGLRKSINVEEAGDDDRPAAAPAAKAEPDGEDDGNVVVRPALSRAGSKKKRKPASRLSFGVRADDDDDDAADAGAPDVVTPKKKSEGSALKKAISLKDLAMRSREDEDRPRYSKEYLDELQSSTPNTPRPSSRADTAPEAEDEMNLDASELEGAVIVEDPSSAPAPAAPGAAPRILTAAEVQEKKERRARLAHEDFIALSDEDDEDAPPEKRKDGGRLARDDENLYEGFEAFVEDEDVALGRRAEREARRRRREEMAEMIAEAEGRSGEESDEEDAGRRAAFEAAQSRAGMDGLKRPARDPGEPAPKPRITPLPSMAECLGALQETLAARRGELEARSRKVAELRAEREEIRGREAEVQRLVNEAGERYKATVAGAGGGAAALEGGSPAAQMLAGDSVEFAAERGLESLGTPTVKRDGDEDLAV